MSDAIVVGAGLGGLSAAIELAARGWRVRVLEAADQLGGKAGVAVVDGVEFDTGPSVLTMPDVLDAVLRAGGSSLKAEIELVHARPAFRYIWPRGDTFDVYQSPEETLASVATTFGADAERDLARFLAYARRIWDAAAPNFVLGPAPSVASLLKLGVRGIGLVGDIDGLRSMDGAIRAYVKHPGLRDVLARYATYNGSDLRSAPATLNCIAWVELGLGGFGVRGGMHAVVRALVRVAEAKGVIFETRRPVIQVRVSGGCITGVSTATGDLDASVVVVNADVGAIVDGLVPGRTGLTVEEPRSTSGCTGVVRAWRRTGVNARVAHTVLFPARAYVQEFADLFDHRRPPVDPTVYVCAQEACHGRPGWADEEPLFFMVNAPAEPSGGSDASAWPVVESTALGRLRESNLISGTDTVVWRRTPTELAARFPGSRGALYGAASNSAFSAFRRPANTVSRVRGLYLASGSAHPGGGMPLCLQSGRQAAAEIGPPPG